jgi:hypothetical protein
MVKVIAKQRCYYYKRQNEPSLGHFEKAVFGRDTNGT